MGWKGGHREGGYSNSSPSKSNGTKHAETKKRRGGVFSSDDKKREGGKKQSKNKNKQSSSSTADIDAWICNKCQTENDSFRSRCSSCQGWKGGHREGYGNKKSPIRGGSSSNKVEKKRKRDTSPVDNVGNDEEQTESATRPPSKRSKSNHGKKQQHGTKHDTNSNTKSSGKRHNGSEALASFKAAGGTGGGGGGASQSHTMAAFSNKQNSAISRRPRQLRPTAKMIAMQEDQAPEKLIRGGERKVAVKTKHDVDKKVAGACGSSAKAAVSSKKNIKEEEEIT